MIIDLYEILQRVLTESVSPREVTDAIEKKNQVIINYSDEENSAPRKRLIEPYVYGLSKAGNPVLRAYQYNGDTKRGIPKWKLFRLDRIQSWQSTGRHFNITPRENGWNAEDYNTNGDGSMSTVLTQVSFDDDSQNKVFSPNDRLNTARLKTAQLKNSNPINIDDLNDNNQPKKDSEIKTPTPPKTNVKGPIISNNTDINKSSNDLNNQENDDFQNMLKRNLDITRKEKERRNFNINNRKKLTNNESFK